MSSLPLISHHLFVAAVAPGDRRRQRIERRASAPANAECVEEPMALEVVDSEATVNAPEPALKPAWAGA